MNQLQLSNAMARAGALADAGRTAEAEAAYRAIIASVPSFHPAYQRLGLLAFDAGKLLIAVELFGVAISLNRNESIYYRNYGEICRRLGRFDEAIQAGMQACKLAPNDIDAHFNLGLACADATQHETASDAFRNVVALQEPFLARGQMQPRMWNLRGNALQRLERFEEARQCYNNALALQPDFALALNGLGSVLKEMGRARESLECLSRAIALNPDSADARLNLAMTQLYLGEWEEGWKNYEARWTGSSEAGKGTFSRPACPLPQWEGHGESKQDGLLVFAEQGFGDSFQFARYLDLAVARFGKVALISPWANTYVLMEWSYGDRVLILKEIPHDFTPWQWQCPLMSMPLAFQTRPDTVPGGVPYLKVSRIAQEHWRARLERAAPGRFRIGITWSGRKSHQYDTTRSMRFEQIAPLLGNRNVTWVSLQKLAAEDQLPTIPASVDWLEWTGDLNDFADTAALVSNLDLIISIDSAMVHLAGALGRPVWMLNRFNSEWRWMEQRENSLWYPTLRIFNQPRFREWGSVVSAVRTALAARVAEYAGAE